MPKLSDRIKELRKSAGMTQEEFGQKFGVVKSTVSLEMAKCRPSLAVCFPYEVPVSSRWTPRKYLIGKVGCYMVQLGK